MCCHAKHATTMSEHLHPSLLQTHKANTLFLLVWFDFVQGSGASKDGQCWRPIAPAGYKSLGDMFVIGYDRKPSPSSPGTPVMVREDCAVRCPVSIRREVWTDRYESGRKGEEAQRIAMQRLIR
jgi:hypothetical protein